MSDIQTYRMLKEDGPQAWERTLSPSTPASLRNAHAFSRSSFPQTGRLCHGQAPDAFPAAEGGVATSLTESLLLQRSLRFELPATGSV